MWAHYLGLVYRYQTIAIELAAVQIAAQSATDNRVIVIADIILLS